MATKFKRAKAEQKASFAPFDPTKHEVLKAGKGRKSEYINTKGEDGKGHIILLGELSQLQDENPKEAILINDAGEIASEGEECTLSATQMIGRNSDGILEIL